MRRFVLFVLFWATASWAYSQDTEQSVYVEDSRSKEYAKKAKEYEDRGDWKDATAIYLRLLDKFSAEVMPVGDKKWQGIPEYILERLSGMPKEPLAQYRSDFNARASHEFELARKDGDLAKLEALLYKYFYTSQGDYQIDWLANSYFESGDAGAAAYWWQRLLRYYPDTKMPKSNIVVKLVAALKLLGDDAALERMKNELQNEITDVDKIIVASHKTSAPQEHKASALKNGIRRWYKHINHKFAPEVPQRAWMIGRRLAPPDEPIPMQHLSPYFASAARIDNKDIVFYQNGEEASAIEPTSGKVIWSATPENVSAGRASNVILNSTVDTESGMVFFDMFSNLSERRQPRANITYSYNLNFPEAIRAMNIATGKILWSTDYDGISEHLKNKDFGFCSAPIVVGRNLYVGIILSPSSEPESYIACLDKSSGKLLWLTFICSLVGQQFYYGYDFGFHNVTSLAEDAGVLYALSNLGAVTAVNKNTGNIIWLAKYKRKGRPGYAPQDMSRPPNRPIIYRGFVYCLPQDSDYLLPYDKYSGDLKDELQCRDVKYLLATEGNYPILAGDTVRRFDTQRSKWQNSEGFSTTKLPRGLVCDGIAYIPMDKGLRRVRLEDLRVIDSEIPKWLDESDCGNIIVAGDNIISVSATRISSYASLDTIEGEFKARIEQEPANFEILVEAGDLFFENKTFEKANDYYLRYLAAVGDIAKYEAAASAVEAKLYELNMALGNKYVNDHDEQLEYFAKAKAYAHDEGRLASALVKMAEVYEAKQMWSAAIDQYQEVLLKCRGAIYKSDKYDMSYRFSFHAYKQVAEIKNKQGDAIYVKYARLAEKDLRSADDNIEALKDLIAQYPNSDSATEALRKLSKVYSKKGDLALSIYYKLFQWNRYNVKGNLDLALSIIDDLEAMGDFETESRWLANLREPFGNMKMPGGSQMVGNFITQKQKELEAKQKTLSSRIALPLVKVADLDIDGYFLKPADEKWSGSQFYFFTDGSTVKCVDISRGQLLWQYKPAEKPDYLGLHFEPTKDPNNSANDAVKITGFDTDSPVTTVIGSLPEEMKERSKVEVDDIITQVDDAPFTISQFTNRIQNLKEGERIKFTIVGSGDGALHYRRIYITNLHEKVAMLKYTPTGAVVLAYQNHLLCLSLKTGKELWRYNLALNGSKTVQLDITYDKVFVLQANSVKNEPQYEQIANPPRMPPFVQARYPVPYNNGGQFTLTCLDLLTGGMEWSRNFEGSVNTNVDVASDIVVVVFLEGQNLKVLSLDATDGKEIGSHNEQSNVFTFDYDTKNNRLILIGLKDNSQTLSVKNITVDNHGIRVEEAFSKQKPGPDAMGWRIMTSKKYVCLVKVIGQVPTIDVYDVANGKKENNISLPPGRRFEGNYIGDITIDDDDILYIYNKHMSEDGNEVYLTAYSLSENPKVLWDVKVAQYPHYPEIKDSYNTDIFVMLSQENTAIVIDKKTGAMHKFYNVRPIRRQSPLVEFAQFKDMVFKSAKAGTVEVYKRK